MVTRKTLLGVCGVMVLFATLSVFALEAKGVGAPAPSGGGEGRTDIIIIDGLEAFGPLEQHAVEFHHDKHTEALAKQGKDCSACHQKREDGRYAVTYQRLDDTAGKDALTDIYHDGCMGCHKELSGGEWGELPLACGSCHVDGPKAVDASVEAGLDLNLHARHVKAEMAAGAAEKDTCKSCHHAYDAAAQKLVYKEGEEGSCRFCHEAAPYQDEHGDTVSTGREAAHIACVNCHVQAKAEKKDSGPDTCAGCHSAAAQAEYKVLDEVPRLMRGQKDVVLLASAKDAADKAGKTLDDFLVAPFNHQAHEGYNDTCRSCHHESMESCAKECHTLQGGEKGDWVQLSEAMHRPTSMHSCVGCHRQAQADPTCAGCHEIIDDKTAFDNSCKVCHIKPDTPYLGGEASREALAQRLIDARPKNYGTVDKDLIPDVVKIDALADQYQPSEFPHGQIILKMVENMKDSELAAAFHQTPQTICESCHHNSPDVVQGPDGGFSYPKCGSCHGKPFDPAKPDVPGLKGAYHGQCIDCHQAMELEKPKATDCEACHKKK